MTGADTDAEPDSDGEEGGEPTSSESLSIDELIAEVAAIDEALASEVASLQDTVEELETQLEERETELDDLESRLKRVHADFQNYKKRAEEREEQIRERATEDLVERLLDVRDNLVRALEQDEDIEVRDGVEATLSTFDRVLDGENVAAIEPAPGDEVDPERHEVVMRVDGDRPADRIEEVYRPGYELADKVLRPAQVTVSEGESED